MKKKKVTFSDIAAYTNFSKTTISRYFNHPDSLTPENQEKIAKALVELDYRENKVARILANGKTEFIGVIVPNLYMHYYSEILNRILDTYNHCGYKFLVFASHNQRESEEQYLRELMAYNIEGLVVLSHGIPSRELADLGIPAVVIEREDLYVSSVNTDNYLGAVLATKLLQKSHCDVLIHVNADVDEQAPAYGRIRGFRDVCEANQLRYELILEDLGNDFSANRTAISQIIDRIEAEYPQERKGLFMSNDTHAHVLLNLLMQRFGHLPSTYQIVGFDGSPVSAEAVVPISTVAQQIERIVTEAMEILFQQIEAAKGRGAAPAFETIHRVIPPVLLRRATTD